MKIGGIQKFSLLDYPGKISAIVFTQGCNFRCRFCYNPMLVAPVSASAQGKEVRSRFTDGSELFDFLESRKGKIEAVVITGGEPTLQPDLPTFAARVKQLGFLVKLDTNGTNPEMIAGMIKDKTVDYIAMDVKAPEEKYDSAAGVKTDLEKIKKSVKIIMDSGLPYEFRTTVAPGLVMPEDIAGIGKLIGGAEKWFLQKFRPEADLVDPEMRKAVPFSDAEMEEMRQVGTRFVKKCETR